MEEEREKRKDRHLGQRREDEEADDVDAGYAGAEDRRRAGS